jgi:hypothetical protein
MQEITPVKRMRTPRYPSREAALAQPELLKLLPQRWRQCRQAAAAAGLLATMAALSAGCDQPATGNSTASLTTATIAESTPMYAGAPTQYPLINEADAMESIRTAAGKKLGALTGAFDTGKSGKQVEFVMLDGMSSGYMGVTMDKPVVDFFDSVSGIGFEYLSDGDAEPQVVDGQTDGNFKPDKTKAHVLLIESEHAPYTNEGKADIEKQVEDFLNWLKAEGIG